MVPWTTSLCSGTLRGCLMPLGLVPGLGFVPGASGLPESSAKSSSTRARDPGVTARGSSREGVPGPRSRAEPGAERGGDPRDAGRDAMRASA